MHGDLGMGWHAYAGSRVLKWRNWGGGREWIYTGGCGDDEEKGNVFVCGLRWVSHLKCMLSTCCFAWHLDIHGRGDLDQPVTNLSWLCDCVFSLCFVFFLCSLSFSCASIHARTKRLQSAMATHSNSGYGLTYQER